MLYVLSNVLYVLSLRKAEERGAAVATLTDNNTVMAISVQYA